MENKFCKGSELQPAMGGKRKTLQAGRHGKWGCGKNALTLYFVVHKCFLNRAVQTYFLQVFVSVVTSSAFCQSPEVTAVMCDSSYGLRDEPAASLTCSLCQQLGTPAIQAAEGNTNRIDLLQKTEWLLP